MTDILNKILATKAEEIAAQKSIISLDEIKKRALSAAPARDFLGAIYAKHAQNIPAIIAEIKKASPSKGLIRADFNPTDIAIAYEKAGAACLSVLTDEQYFQGSPEYLQQAKAAVSLPVLRKDFIIDEYQIYQARSWGADAILLIATALTTEQLKSFEKTALKLGMAVLLELHDADEIQKSASLTTPLWGVNNRNLRTFEVNLQQTLDLLPQLSGKTVVTESGIFHKDDIILMQNHGVHTFLIGESFMRADDIEMAVKQLF